MTKPCIAGLLCGLLVATVQAVELPQSGPCQVALLALADAEDALVAPSGAASATSVVAVPQGLRQRAVATRLLPLRQRVADACLGGQATSPSTSRHSWHVPTPPRPSAPVRPVPVSPKSTSGVTQPRADMPLILSHCTGATCLASDGATLTRVGPMLVGPRGMCTTQGVFLQCP